MMRGRKPAPAQAKANIISGVFPRGPVELVEPNWREKIAGEEWGKRQSKIASGRWREIVSAMRAMGTLGPENSSAIEIASTNYARWKLAEAHVAEHGPVVAAPRTGVPMQNPYLSIANSAAAIVIKLEAELGLPPSMRGRVTKSERGGGKEKGPADGWDADLLP